MPKPEKEKWYENTNPLILSITGNAPLPLPYSNSYEISKLQPSTSDTAAAILLKFGSYGKISELTAYYALKEYDIPETEEYKILYDYGEFDGITAYYDVNGLSYRFYFEFDGIYVCINAVSESAFSVYDMWYQIFH